MIQIVLHGIWKRKWLYLVIFFLFILFFSYKKFKQENAPIVTTSSKTSEKIMEEYQKKAEKSPADALATLRNDSAHDTKVLSMCHKIAHEIGRISYKQNNNFTSALLIQDPICNSGYLHGVIEAYLAKNSLSEGTLKNTCPPHDIFTYYDWECSHGIGHGLMYSNRRNFEDSMKLCLMLSGKEMQHACQNGVFMEFFDEDIAKDKKDFDSLSFCSEQSDEYKNDCYLYAPQFFLALHPQDYKGAFAWCRDKEGKNIPACIQGVAGIVMKEHFGNVQFVEEICASSPNYETCITGAVNYAFFHFGSSKPLGFICLQFSDKGQSICSDLRKKFITEFPETR